MVVREFTGDLPRHITGCENVAKISFSADLISLKKPIPKGKMSKRKGASSLPEAPLELIHNTTVQPKSKPNL